jgi:hypothetical protein
MVKRWWTMGRLNDFKDPDPCGPPQKEVVLATDYDALKEQRDFAVRELKAILFMLQREKGKEGK